MLKTINRNSLDREQVLYQYAVDNEFRTELLDDPETFGMQHNNRSLPDPIAQQDHTSWERWNEEMATIVNECASTCSYGPLTVVCDGFTK